MHPPRLRALHPESLSFRLLAELKAGLTGPVRLFVVVEPGRFDARPWGVGDVIVCAGTSAEGVRTVLEPEGRGRPVLGKITADGMTGAWDEPCHPLRWTPVGRIVRVLAGAVDVQPEVIVRPQLRLAPAPRQEIQLALFAPA